MGARHHLSGRRACAATWSPAPTIGISVGVGPIAEIQIDGSLYRHLRVTERPRRRCRACCRSGLTETHAVDDFVIATKLRLLNEASGRPAIGLRFATRLPNASNESGLGQDTTDFYASFLLGKTVKSLRMVGNAGVAIVGDPTTGGPAGRSADLRPVDGAGRRRRPSSWSPSTTAG